MVTTINIHVNLSIGQENKIEPLIEVLHLMPYQILFVSFMLKNGSCRNKRRFIGQLSENVLLMLVKNNFISKTWL